MASLFEENLQCPVCRDIFRDPVLLLCSHSFCRACVDEYWEHSDSRICPECRTDFYMDQPPCNRALKTLCEIFLQDRSKRACAEALRCEEHGETLELFCLEERRLLCGVCVDEDKHHQHTCTPVDEAAHTLKEEIKTRLTPLQENLKLLYSEKFSCSQRVKHIKNQAEQAEADLRTEFEALHQFLREEEELRVTALREEEEQRRMKMEEHILSISSQISELAQTLRNTEEEIHDNNISFLMKYKGQPDSSQSFSPSPEDPPEELMDVVKHLGNLRFNVWQKMRTVAQYSPVVLDPNTAHPCLRVSGGLNTLRFGHWSPPALCYEDEREGYPSVLGSKGFGSGTHCWDVEVGDSSIWAIGVISESTIQDQSPSSGLWRLGFHNGVYGQGCSGEYLSELEVKQKVQRVRVHLDWDAGKVSFLDALTGDHIHTFTHRFTDRLFPYFCNACPSEELKILPVEEPNTPIQSETNTSSFSRIVLKVHCSVNMSFTKGSLLFLIV